MKISFDKKSLILSTKNKANKIGEMAVPKVEPEKIVDTSSAGDAFVGGFLAQFVKSEPIEKCLDCGIWASGLIIQRHGCTFPNTMEYM